MHLVKNNTLSKDGRQDMADREVRFTLANLIKHTEKMLKQAEMKQWATVEAMEAERREGLEHLSKSEGFEFLSNEVAEAFATLISINEKISDLIESEKKDVMAHFEKDNSKVKAVRCYQTMN